MLKALLLLLMNVVLVAMTTAQNLVPNPGFEDTVDCETSVQCTLLTAEHWRNPNPPATPDVHDCDLERVCGSLMDPDLGLAYQFAEDGVRLAGLFFWYGPSGGNTREYLMVRLIETLDAGVSYEVELAYSRRRYYHQLAIDHIGVWFGMDSLFEPEPDWLDVTPQVRLGDPDSTYLTVGGEWTMLADTFVAQGGERWMVIGNFDVAGTVDGIVAEPTGIQPSCYYYIDAVSVEPLITEDVQSRSESDGRLWTNAEWIVWEGEAPLESVVLFDSMGRRSWSLITTTHLKRLPVPTDLAQGAYVVEVVAGGRRYMSRFIR